MRKYYNDLKAYGMKKSYIVPVLLIALLCFGYAITNASINIDNLEGDRYVNGNVMLAAGRFGITLMSMFTGDWATAYVNDILSVVFLLWTATNICILFDRVSGGRINSYARTIFSCAFVSYPLIHEIWPYSAYSPSFCLLFMSWALLLVYACIRKRQQNRFGMILAAVLLMMLVCAGYESIVPVYIFFVFALLSLQIVYGTEQEKKLRTVLQNGMVFAGVLVVGLLLRVAVHQITLAVLDLESATNGATEIYWSKYSVDSIIKSLFVGFAKNYVLKGIIYFPITELLAAGVAFLIIGFFACKKHGALLLVPGLGMLLSLILLSIVQGEVSPYRTCQVFGAFVSFVAMILADLFQEGAWHKWVKNAGLVLLAYLCFYQATYVNYYMVQNHLRSEEEAFVIRQIGMELQGEYSIEKPVIFVGNYALSESIQEAISVPESSASWQAYKTIFIACYDVMGETYDETKLSRRLPQTNVNSVLEWGVYSYNQEAMQNLFAYYGFDYVLADYELVYDEACQYAVTEQMPSYPQNGYIRDVGEYIIVRLGEVEG